MFSYATPPIWKTQGNAPKNPTPRQCSQKPYHHQGNAPKKPSLNAILEAPIDKPSLVKYCKGPNIDLSTTHTLNILMKFKILSWVINLSIFSPKPLLCKYYNM